MNVGASLLNGNIEVDRVALIKNAHRLTLAFLVWAIVAGVVGALAMFVLSRIWNEQRDHEARAERVVAELRQQHHELEREVRILESKVDLISERQQVVMRRLDRLEDRQK